MPKIVVDWPACDGNGTCALEPPALIEMDDDDNPIVLQERLGADLLAQAQAAIRRCPKQALSIGESR